MSIGSLHDWWAKGHITDPLPGAEAATDETAKPIATAVESNRRRTDVLVTLVWIGRFHAKVVIVR